jgi:hypothetical protein
MFLNRLFVVYISYSCSGIHCGPFGFAFLAFLGALEYRSTWDLISETVKENYAEPPLCTVHEYSGMFSRPAQRRRE